MNSTLTLALLDSIAENGGPSTNEENGENDGSGLRNRMHNTEDHSSGHGATDSAKPYTTEQLDAVKRFVIVTDCFPNMGIYFVINVFVHLHSVVCSLNILFPLMQN